MGADDKAAYQTPICNCDASGDPATGHRPWCGMEPDDCPHVSWSGDEGPIALLGRFPKRWRCDVCGTVMTDD